MALTVEVTSAWPQYHNDGLFRVGVNIVLNDDDTEYRCVDKLEQKRGSFLVPVRKTEDPEIAIDQLRRRIQEWIDAYKTEKNARKHAKYETMRNGVATGLNLAE